MTPKPKVIYWNNMPSPYMVDRFNAIVNLDEINFEAWFNDRIVPDRSWTVDETNWKFRYRYLPVTKMGRIKLHWPLPIITYRPDVLFSLYAAPSFVLGWMIAYLTGVKTCFRVLKTYDSWVKRSRAKDLIKRFIFQHVHAIETPGPDGENYAIQHGAKQEKIFRATHTIDVNYLAAESARARRQRREIREQLGLKGLTYLYVGRLWSGKGLSFLLDAFRIVQKTVNEDVSLLIVGDGPDEAQLRIQCNDVGLMNVIFSGFIQKQYLPHFFAASDIFVFPTLGDPYGLVIDEAMACSLPVISTYAAGEIRERVIDGFNGFLVEPRNSIALAHKMITLFTDTPLRLQMSRMSMQRVSENTAERWAEDFLDIVRHLYKKH